MINGAWNLLKRHKWKALGVGVAGAVIFHYGRKIYLKAKELHDILNDASADILKADLLNQLETSESVEWKLQVHFRRNQDVGDSAALKICIHIHKFLNKNYNVHIYTQQLKCESMNNSLSLEQKEHILTQMKITVFVKTLTALYLFVLLLLLLRIEINIIGRQLVDELVGSDKNSRYNNDSIYNTVHCNTEKWKKAIEQKQKNADDSFCSSSQAFHPISMKSIENVTRNRNKTLFQHGENYAFLTSTHNLASEKVISLVGGAMHTVVSNIIGKISPQENISLNELYVLINDVFAMTHNILLQPIANKSCTFNAANINGNENMNNFNNEEKCDADNNNNINNMDMKNAEIFDIDSNNLNSSFAVLDTMNISQCMEKQSSDKEKILDSQINSVCLQSKNVDRNVNSSINNDNTINTNTNRISGNSANNDNSINISSIDSNDGNSYPISLVSLMLPEKIDLDMHTLPAESKEIVHSYIEETKDIIDSPQFFNVFTYSLDVCTRTLLDITGERIFMSNSTNTSPLHSNNNSSNNCASSSSFKTFPFARCFAHISNICDAIFEQKRNVFVNEFARCKPVIELCQFVYFPLYAAEDNTRNTSLLANILNKKSYDDHLQLAYNKRGKAERQVDSRILQNLFEGTENNNEENEDGEENFFTFYANENNRGYF